MKTAALIFMVLLIVAIVVEAIVEYAKTIIKMFTEKDYKTAVTQLVTIGLGVFMAFQFDLQLFNKVLSEFYPINPDATFDTILTGILLSRGSNYMSDLVKRFMPSQITALVPEELYNQDEFNPDVLQIKIGDGSDMDEFLGIESDKDGD